MTANKVGKILSAVFAAAVLMLTACLLCLPHGVSARADEALIETVISSDFEDESVSPWTSNGNCTHTVVSDGANKVLRSALISGNTQNRVQRRISVGQGDGFLQEGKWYDISFRAKAESKIAMNGVAAFNNESGNFGTLYPISDSYTHIGGEWTTVSLGFSFRVSDGMCKFLYRRPDMDSPASHEVASSSAVTSVDLIFYTSADVWYFDDFKVETEATEMKFDNYILKSDFEDGDTRPWTGGDWASHGITSDAFGGDKALVAIKSDGASQNRAQVNLTVSGAGNTLTEGVWHSLRFAAKADKNAKLYIVFTINYGGGNKEVSLAGGDDLTSSYAEFTSGILFEKRNSSLYASWQRTDMTSPTSDTFQIPEGSTDVTSVDLIIYSPDAQVLYLDDIVLSTKISVSVAAGRVINKIAAIGKVTEDSKAAIDEAFEAYEALEPSVKSEVFNYSDLVAAKRSYALRDGLVAGTFDDSDVIFRFAALSDTHNNNVAQALQTVSSWEGKKLDACVVAGDITEAVEYQGLTHEIPQVKKCFEDNLADDVAIFMALGNHDSSAGSHADTFYDGLGERFYREVLDKDYTRRTANAHAVIGGYHFIAIEADYTREVIPADTVQYLSDTLESITSDPNYGGEYIFLVSHVSMANTVAGCSPIDTLTPLLESYPQVIALTGHSHHTLYDELNIMQTGYTTVCLGSVSYTPFEERTYLESLQFGLIDESYDLSCGAIVEADGKGNVKITRIDFRLGEEIASPWILSAPKADGSHLLAYPQERKTVFASAPVFAEGAKVDATYSSAKSVTVTFDTATDDSYVEYYRIELYDEGTSVPYKTVNTLSGFYLYPKLSDMPSVKTVEITDLKRLPHGVKITAYDSANSYSETLSATAHKSANDAQVTVESLNIDNKAMTYSAGENYEVATDAEFKNIIPNSGSLSEYAGATLYVREKENEFRAHSAYASFTVSDYRVTFPTSAEYKIYKGSDADSYFVGSRCEFSVSLAEGYEKHIVTVKANGKTLEADSDGIYGFAVTEDTEITVELTAPSAQDPSGEDKSNTDGEKENGKSGCGCKSDLSGGNAVAALTFAVLAFVVIAAARVRIKKRG